MATRRRTTKPNKPQGGGSSGFANPNREKSSEELHEDAMRVLNREYWEGVRGLAKEVAERVKDEGGDRSDILHEVVDGSYWVIYTHANFQVLMCSSYHDAYTEDFGEIPGDGRDGINWAALAYAALARDVSEQVDAEMSDLEEAPRRMRTSTVGSRAARRGR